MRPKLTSCSCPACPPKPCEGWELACPDAPRRVEGKKSPTKSRPVQYPKFNLPPSLPSILDKRPRSSSALNQCSASGLMCGIKSRGSFSSSFAKYLCTTIHFKSPVVGFWLLVVGISGTSPRNKDCSLGTKSLSAINFLNNAE